MTEPRWKRAFDVIAAALGLLVTAPLLVLAALGIRLSSPGPVLYRARRVGRRGDLFTMYKLRTMHATRAAPGSAITAHEDPRVFPWGRLLRRAKIDELPQLVNVLRGEMNLIGPRPHPTSNHAVFVDDIAYYGLRNSVRPGVTGWAQVRYGYANNLEEETEKMRYDLFYIKNRSLWLDMRILFETVGIIVFGQGASEVRRPSPSRSELVPATPRRRDDVAAYMPWLANSTAARPSGGQQ